MTSVRVTSNDSRYGQAVTIRQFHLAADEPPSLGGDDTGPTLGQTHLKVGSLGLPL
jgi:putative redox protein